ncbi:hypothetical protein NP161_22630, partial [Salmonella enterica]|nr:hypothetical protein [Salmonella enterica]
MKASGAIAIFEASFKTAASCNRHPIFFLMPQVLKVALQSCNIFRGNLHAAPDTVVIFAVVVINPTVFKTQLFNLASTLGNQGTVAKLAMRQPFVLFKGLTFQKLCLP